MCLWDGWNSTLSKLELVFHGIGHERLKQKVEALCDSSFVRNISQTCWATNALGSLWMAILFRGMILENIFTFPGKKIHVPWKKYLQLLEKKFRLLWPCGPLVLWLFGPLVLWSSGPVVLWSCGPLVLWSSGPLVLWLLVLWSSGPVVLWCCRPLVLWSSGPVVLWSCGPLVLWFCGCVVLWSSGPKNSTNCESRSMFCECIPPNPPPARFRLNA